MIGLLLLCVVNWAVVGLAVWQIRNAIRERALKIRGATYERKNQPVAFFISFALLIVAVLLCGAIASISTLGLIGIIE